MNENNELKLLVQKQGRLLKMYSILFIFMSSSLLIGAKVAVNNFDHISVKRLALVDENGTERLILATNDKLLQVNGEVVERRSGANGLILKNEHGDEIGGMIALNDGTKAVMLDDYSEYGATERAGIFVLPNGSSGIIVKDPKGKVRVKLGVDQNMYSVLNLNDGQSTPQINGSVSEDGLIDWIQK